MSENNAAVIEGRKPILDQESAKTFPPKNIDRQWNFITEAIRRDIATKPEIRKQLEVFCVKPVSETLPNECIDLLSKNDPRIANLAERYKSEAKAYLVLPPVPDEQIKPDIRNAPSYYSIKPRMDAWRKYYPEIGEEGVRNKAREFLKNNKEGITREEREMIGIRYGYARDVKRLALGAEILEQSNLTPNENGEIILPSGVKIVVDIDQGEAKSDLLNPHLWQRRVQLKDRVYEIEVNNRKYILKEKKTVRHKDTMKGEHRDGNLSSEEFSVAKYFQEHGGREKGNVKVSWEKPVGFVSYPDGFQFAIFEFEEGLIEDRAIIQQLATNIIEHQDQFRDEYQLIAKLVGDKHKDTLENLTFKEFAMTKALRMERQVNDLMEETAIINGYSNRDRDGYSYKITNEDQLQLEIIGFDFEYFSKMSSDQVTERLKIHKKSRKEWDRDGISFLFWNDGSDVTEVQKAAYFAMLETEGFKKTS